MKNKFLNTWIQRAAAVLLVFLGSMSSILADTKLYVEDFSIKTGESKKVTVCLDTDLANIGNVTMTVNLPDGLDFVSTKNEWNQLQIQTEADATRTPGFTVLGSAKTHIISVYGNTMNTKAIPAGTGAFCYFYVKDNGMDGSGTITLSNVSVTTTSYDDVDGVVVAGGAVSKNGGTASGVTMSFAEDNISMDPGSTKEIGFNIENSGHKFNMMLADIAVPAGWTVSVIGKRGEFTCNYIQSTGLYRLMNVDGIEGGTGEAFALQLVAPANFVGSAQVSIKDIQFNLDDAIDVEKISDMSLTVTATGAVATKPTVSFGAESAVIGAGKTANVDVNMVNVGQNVTGFMADVVVPEGWTWEYVDGRILKDDATVTKKRIIWVTPDFVQIVPGDDGAIFSLSLTAPEAFEGEAEVKVANIQVTVGTSQFKLDDISLTVKAHDDEAKAAADAIVAALKEKFDGAKADMLEDDVTKIDGEIGELEADVETKYNDVTLVVEDVQAAADAISAEIDAALAAKVEADAKAAAETKLGELKAAAEPLAVSDEAKAYEAENVQEAVAAAEQAIADANTAVAAVEAKIAEGNLSTDNKEALAEAVAAAEQAIADAKTAAEAAEKAYADQKAADEAAAAEAAAKEAALAAQAKVKEDAAAAKEAVPAEVADDADVKAAAAVLDANITALDNAIENAETFKDNKTIAAAQKAAEDAVTALTEKATAAKEAYDKAQAEAAEAAAKTAAETKLAELKAAAEAVKVSDEAKAYDNDDVKAAVAAAEQAIADANDAVAAVEAKIAEGNLSTDNKNALAEAVAAAEQAIADAKTAAEAAEKAYADQKAEDDAAAAEAAAKTAAETKLAELKAAAEAVKVSDEAKAYDNDDVKAAVAAAENAIADANDAVAAVEAKIAEGNLSTDNKDALAEAVAAAEQAIADAKTAAEAAEKAYADQKTADDDAAAAEAAAKTAAETKLAELKAAAEAVKVSDEAKAYDNDDVKAAVAAAENAIADANDAVAAVEAKIAEGNLSTDNKDALAEAVAAAEQAIADAKTAAEAAEKAYADQKAEDDAAAAEAAAKDEALKDQAQVKTDAEAAKDAIPAEVADDEDVKAAAEALDKALADLDKAIADAESFKDNEAIAAAQKAAEDAVTALTEKAAAAKEAYDKAQAEKKAANETAYNKLINQINQLQSKLDMAQMTVDASCPDVADNYTDQIKAIQDAIDGLKNQLEDDYAAVALNADSKLDADAVAKIEEDVAALVKDAGKAQAAFVANREAYLRLTATLDDLKDEYDDAMAIITDKEKYPDAETNMAEDIANVQKMIADAEQEIEDGYKAGTLNADSSIDAAAIKKAIADLLEKAKIVGIVAIRNVENAEAYYDLNGRPLSVPRAGQTVIVKMKDGSSKKILLK